MKPITELMTSYPNTVAIGVDAFKDFKVDRPIHVFNSRSKRLMAIIPVEAVEKFLYTATIKTPRSRDAKDRYGAAENQFYRLIIPKEFQIKVGT